MSVTAAQVQQIVVLRVGETDAGALAANIAVIWASYADKAAIAPRLQMLFTQRDCIDIALAEVRQQVGFTAADLTVRLAEKSANLQAMRAAVETEIHEVERLARAARGGVLAALSTVEPIAPPTVVTVSTVPDGSDSRYRGDVYKPLVREGI